LLLDQQNARLPEPQESQEATEIALTTQLGSKIVQLASHLAEFGPDPTNSLAVVQSDTSDGDYVVLEGNRRLLAIRALTNPEIIASALNNSDQKRLRNLAEPYSRNPIDALPCVIFENENDANTWIELRHTGENKGKGLVPWASDERDRFASRRGPRTVERQILDFVSRSNNLSPGAETSRRGIITNIKRLMTTPDVRDRLGLDIRGGRVFSVYPAAEVLKGLTRVVEDFASGEVRVKDIYLASDRREYISTFDDTDLPDQSQRLDTPQALDEITQFPVGSTRRRRTRRATTKTHQRATLIPTDCVLYVQSSRIEGIHRELRQLRLETYPNTIAVLFRVFIELSVDHYITLESLMSEKQQHNLALAKRLKTVAHHMVKEKKIQSALEKAIRKVADSSQLLAPSTITFNQYVHNKYVIPSPLDLRSVWDELQPFLQAIWVPPASKEQ